MELQQFRGLELGEHTKIFPFTIELYSKVTKEATYDLKNGQSIHFHHIEYNVFGEVAKCRFTISDI